MKSRVAWALALASSCLVAGCNDDTVANGGGSGTAGGSDTDTGESSSGEPPFDGVRLNTVVTFVAADGSFSMRSVPPSESNNAWAVEVGTGAAREVFTGYYDPVGWYELPGVPEGPYLLRRTYDVPWFTALDLREIEADGVLRAGRATALSNRSGTGLLTLTVSSMTPLGEDDSFELYSRNVDALDRYPGYGSLGTALGSTSIDGVRIPWVAENIVEQLPVVDPAAGDDLWLTHLAAAPLVAEPPPGDPDDAWTTTRSQRLVEVAALELDEAITDIVSADASGSFMPVEVAPVSLDLRLEQFRAGLRTILGAQLDSVTTYCWARVVVAPGEEMPVDGMAPVLAQVWVNNACPSSTCDEMGPPPSDRVVELMVGNPFGSGTEMLEVGCSAQGTVTHPEANTQEGAEVELWFTRPLGEGGLVVPGLGMPSDIRIGGEPCGMDDALTGVGTTPTISLAAPSLGTADYYEVSVAQLKGADDLGSPYLVGGFLTTATTFTLPEGLLQPGSYYRLQIEVHNGRRLGEGRAYSHAQYRNQATSGVFTP